jgi:hypothetical protein
MPFLAVLLKAAPLVLQALTMFMGFRSQLAIPGADKKALVVQDVKTIAPLIVQALPESDQLEAAHVAQIADTLITAATGSIDAIHASAKANPDIYPAAIAQALGEAKDVLGQVKDVVDSVPPAAGMVG